MYRDLGVLSAYVWCLLHTAPRPASLGVPSKAPPPLLHTRATCHTLRQAVKNTHIRTLAVLYVYSHGCNLFGCVCLVRGSQSNRASRTELQARNRKDDAQRDTKHATRREEQKKKSAPGWRGYSCRTARTSGSTKRRCSSASVPRSPPAMTPIRARADRSQHRM